MRIALNMLAICGGLMIAASANALPPPSFSPFMPEWRFSDEQPQPGVHLEMITALQVASERCSGTHGRMLARYMPRMLDWRRGYFETVGNALWFHYRRVYGERWEAVLEGQLAGLRRKYQLHPDQKRFCKLAAIVARDASGEHGQDGVWRLFTTMIRHIDPAAVAAPTAAN